MQAGLPRPERFQMDGSSYKVEEIARQHRQRLLHLAHRMVGDADTAEDIVQDALLIVHKKIHEFRGEADVFTWVYRITANLCLKARSALDTERPRQSEEDPVRLSDTAVIGDTDEIRDLKNNPEKNLLYRELLMDIRKECHYLLLRLLTKEQRIVFLLRVRLGLGFARIGEILEISENAAKSRMNRAIRMIEEDVRKRCSLHSPNAKCRCDDWVMRTVYRNPALLKDLPMDKAYVEEIKNAFKSTDVETLYRMLP
jgi:RNA polymerase sigma-70 factor (ECF subfamily)